MGNTSKTIIVDIIMSGLKYNIDFSQKQILIMVYNDKRVLCYHRICPRGKIL
jgi:hypothetical protein